MSRCEICNKSCKEVFPCDHYYHEKCLDIWRLEKQEEELEDRLYYYDCLVDDFLDDTDSLLTSEKKYLQKTYKYRQDLYIFETIVEYCLNSGSDKSNIIFKFMIDNGMIVENTQDRYKLSTSKKEKENIESCKVRDECVGHKSSYTTGRCGGSICDDCGYYSGQCMSSFSHCCCYKMN
jgi:hypothetical protein